MIEVTGQTSDGFHTFDELYEHRSALFVALMHSRPYISWYAYKHSDETMFDGMFIAGMNLPTGQITYHLNIKPWLSILGQTRCKGMKFAPEYDGHSSEDVIERLLDWIRT